MQPFSFCGPVTYSERQERLCDFMKNSLSQSFCSAQPPSFLSISQPSQPLYIILLNSCFLYCNFSSLLFLHTQVSLVFFFSPHRPHSIISLLLHIFSLANVLPSLIHTLEYSHTHARAHTHIRTNRPFSSASLSECDWLITTQKAWLCWCQKQDRYLGPQGAQGRLMSLSFTTPFSFSHFPSAFSSFTLPHADAHWPQVITGRAFCSCTWAQVR